MSNLLTRAISGAVFVAVLVFGILYNLWSLKILFLVIVTLGLYEFYGIVGIKKARLLSTLLGAGLFTLLTQFYPFTIDAMAVFMAISAFFFLIELFSTNGSYQNASLRITGLVYIIIPLSYVTKFNLTIVDNAWILLGMFILIWSNDTGAYLIGRFFGKNKLFERISPKKTIEGLIGGGACAIGISLLLNHFIGILPIYGWIGIAIIVFVFANLGDLVESMLKRNYGVKDSGNIIPGHGGILDRFDGVLLTVPIVYLFLQLI